LLGLRARRVQPPSLRQSITGAAMRATNQDKWVAFLLSLAVPGAGQLFAGRATFVLWLAAVIGIASLAGSLAPLAIGLLGIFSAEHAKRCCEPGRPRSRRGTVRIRVHCELLHKGTVRLAIELAIPKPVSAVWAVVADLPRFLCIDPFHSRVVLLGTARRPGVELALEHRAFGVTLWRFGRLLNWRDGAGYAFSDLSARGPRRGFPHVFFVSVEQTEAGTRLLIRVRGKWTARWLPRPLVRLWLWYVCHDHARLLRAAFEESC